MKTGFLNMKRYLFAILLGLFAVSFYSCDKNSTNIVLSTDEFVKYNVNGIDYSFIMPADSVFPNMSDSIESPSFFPSNSVTASRIPGSLNDFFKISYYRYGTSLGSIQTITLFYTSQTGIFPSPITSANPVLLTITEYGTIGEYIAGNFSATFNGPQPGNLQYNVTCSFRVKRRI
jgi:hypothetical protein